jgi:hypothetical protein
LGAAAGARRVKKFRLQHKSGAPSDGEGQNIQENFLKKTERKANAT